MDSTVRDFYSKDVLREWRRLVVEIIECAGLEGLGSHSIAEINRLARSDPAAWENWLEAHDAFAPIPRSSRQASIC